jgi:hypothetical protein
MDEFNTAGIAFQNQPDVIYAFMAFAGLKKKQITGLNLPLSQAFPGFGHIPRNPWDGNILFLKTHINQTGTIHSVLSGAAIAIRRAPKTQRIVCNAPDFSWDSFGTFIEINIVIGVIALRGFLRIRTNSLSAAARTQ